MSLWIPHAALCKSIVSAMACVQSGTVAYSLGAGLGWSLPNKAHLRSTLPKLLGGIYLGSHCMCAKIT